MPRGADAIVMVEHVTRGANGAVTTGRTADRGQFINPRGCEAQAGEAVLTPGKRLGFADVAMLAAIGKSRVAVCPSSSLARASAT